MTLSSKTLADKAGLPPGSLVHIGAPHHPTSTLSIIEYNKTFYAQKQIESLEEIPRDCSPDSVSWIIIEGLSDVEAVNQVGSAFGVHSLVLEDIVNTHQRPKLEEYDDHLFIVLKRIRWVEQDSEFYYEQISILLFHNTVIVFKEKADDFFEPIIKRIQGSKGRFRSQGTDYLAYVILDAIVDECFTLIDLLDDEIINIEEVLLGAAANQETLNSIQRLKRETITIGRYLSPVRELMDDMLRSETELIQDKTRPYFRDVADHAIRVIESIQIHREILTGLMDIYLSNVSLKMNEIMKVLTVFASIFIPLTFLAGIYGMNFEHMPELHWKWSYPAIWGTFIIVPAAILYFFRKQKWI